MIDTRIGDRKIFASILPDTLRSLGLSPLDTPADVANATCSSLRHSSADVRELAEAIDEIESEWSQSHDARAKWLRFEGAKFRAPLPKALQGLVRCEWVASWIAGSATAGPFSEFRDAIRERVQELVYRARCAK